jgi:hypothetical protein
MALRFSSGLLTGLQQYGQGGGIPADPRQRDAMQAAGVTNPLLQQFGRGLGGMLGTEMRSPMAIQQAQMEEQQAQARQVYSQALKADPQKQMELASQLMNIQGYEKDALALAQQAQTKLEQQQARLQEQQQRETFANRARALGLSDTAELVLAGGDLKEAGKQIREEEKRRALIRGGKPARIALARRAGMSDQFIKELQEGKFDATDESEFAKILEGDQADLEVFLNTEGKAVPMRVDKYGKIYDPTTGTFRNPSELGVTQAPQLTQQVETLDQVTKALLDVEVDQYAELRKKADSAISLLEINKISEEIGADGLISGLGGQAKLNVIKALETVGLAPEEATQLASNTEAFFAYRGRAVAEVITAFGSGTGLSDKDREYAQKIAAGEITLTRESIAKLLEIERRHSRNTILANNEAVRRMFDLTGDMSAAEKFYLPVPEFGSTAAPTGGELSPAALRYLPITGQ